MHPVHHSLSFCLYARDFKTFNYIFGTRKVVFMVEEVVIGKKENAKPLTLGN